MLLLRGASLSQFEEQKAYAQKLFGEGRAGEAVARAKVLNRMMADDLDVYALLVDGHRQLGNLDEAEKAANWMLHLRPSDPRSLMRAADLRVDFGMHDSALQLLRNVYQITPETDRTARLAVLRRVQHVYEKMNRPEDAARYRAEIERLSK
jgi:tetratricopeptide (TPR) repeat protein